MAKIACVTDTHWGVRGSSRAFAKNQADFWKFFWAHVDETGVEAILHGGDAADKRKSIDFLTYADMKRDFFDPAKERNLPIYIIVGNHCVYYKNTNSVNSLDLLLGEYDNVHVISSEPKTIVISERAIDMVPWFYNELYDKTIEFINQTKSTVMLGHLELSGFEFHKGIVNKHGMDKKLFSRYHLVMSGHYHTKSASDNIVYLGATSEYTWADANDPRGFHYLDLNSLDLEFVQNPHPMFYRIVIDESEEPCYDELSGKIVRLIQGKECSLSHFRNVVEKVRESSPEELDTIEKDEISLVESDVEIDVEATETSEFIQSQIKSLEGLSETEKQKLIDFFNEIYTEALED